MRELIPDLEKLKQQLVKKRSRLEAKATRDAWSERSALMAEIHALRSIRPSTERGYLEKEKVINQLHKKAKDIDRACEYVASKQYYKDMEEISTLRYKISKLDSLISAIQNCVY
jgi:hypothetical protein